MPGTNFFLGNFVTFFLIYALPNVAGSIAVPYFTNRFYLCICLSYSLANMTLACFCVI